MARKIIHQLVDDIDGTVLEPGQGETIIFALDGTSYEIDLTEAHSTELRAALAPFISAGRRLQRTTAATSSAAKRTARNPETKAIRAWAAENGHAISERGRIPATIIEAYRAAH